jgi:hypothetical protein
MRPRATRFVGGLVVVLAACTSSPGQTSLTAPLPTSPPIPTTVAASSTIPPATSSSTSTVASATTSPTSTLSTVATTELLPDGIGKKVNAAPGVNTPGDIRELMPNVWVFIPSAPDPNDNHVQPPLAGDIDIIAAYIEERTANFELITQRPLPTVLSPRLIAASTPTGLDGVVEKKLKPFAAAGMYYDISGGILFRPVVIAEPRSDTEAFVFDCQIDATGWRNADGSFAEGDTPGVKRSPQIARMKKIDGRWLTDGVSTDDRVCA